ncbi:MAG: efflux RND transporter periplasmic adaptor subunit [Pseudomonadota bacterium]
MIKTFIPAFLFSLLMLAACGEEQQDMSAPIRQVKVMQIMDSSSSFEQSFSGTLRSTAEISYSFKVSGTVETLPVKVGDTVGKGAILATLDSSDYELQVEKAEANLAQSMASYQNAKANYTRVKRLYEAGDSSRSELDSARAESGTNLATVQANRKALEIAKKDLKYTSLRSEGACAIASVSPDIGENVNSGEQIIYATCGDKLEVKLNIPESVIAYIEKDMPAKVSFPAIRNKTFDGIVTEVGVSSVSGRTTFPVDVLITGTDMKLLKAGLSADVVFAIDSAKAGQSNAIIVPAFAVGEDQNGRFVFTVAQTEEGKTIVKRSPVTVGDVQQNGVVILDGVNAGDFVVTAGVSVLRDGMEVKAVQNVK